MSRKLYRFLLMFSTGFTSLSDLFFLYRSLTSSLSTVFDSILSDIDEVLSINPSGGTDRPGELSYNFSVSNNLTHMVNFPAWIPDCDSHSPALLDLFLSSHASSTVAFPP